jgi:cytochrome c-type biogenesis protein CcmE
VDLSPRQATDVKAPVGRGKRWPAIVVLCLVLAGGGVIVTKFLTSAIDYYCNVDELGNKSGCEADRRLRVQGNVEEGSVQQSGGVTTFLMTFNGVELPVRYEGEPGGIFQECVPVVVHGRLDQQTAADGTFTRVFNGDRVEVKHDNEYAAENADRLNQANAACSQPA